MGEETPGSSLKKIVLDTYSLIKFFKDEPDAGNVQKILSMVERGEVKCTVSTITFA